MDFLKLLNSIDSLIWGPPLLVLLVGTGIYFTIRLGLIQIVKLPKALKLIFKAENNGSGDISSFGALYKALPLFDWGSSWPWQRFLPHWSSRSHEGQKRDRRG